jgi:hypothetical protein
VNIAVWVSAEPSLWCQARHIDRYAHPPNTVSAERAGILHEYDQRNQNVFANPADRRRRRCVGTILQQQKAQAWSDIRRLMPCRPDHGNV